MIKRLRNLISIKTNRERIFGLDILRALAIFFVVAGHGAYLMQRPFYFKYIDPFIYDGVSIFFVLSGYLIGSILIKIISQNKMSLKLILNFWIRRWLRTVPNYILIIIVLIILNSLFNNKFILNDTFKYFIFSQNILASHLEFFPESWSISIEEWFYISLPIILYLLIKILKININKSILIAATGVIISITLYRYFKYINPPLLEWDSHFRKLVITRLDSLMYGVLGAYLSIRYKQTWKNYKIAFFIIGIIIFLAIKIDFFEIEQNTIYKYIFSFSSTSIATLLLLPYLSSIKKGRGFFLKIVTHISLISYSMYLINLTIIQNWIINKIEWTFLQDINWYLYRVFIYSFYWLLTIIISTIIYKYFEVPIMNLRDLKIFKKSSEKT